MVWPIPFLMNMFAALKGSQFYFYSYVRHALANVCDCCLRSVSTGRYFQGKATVCNEDLKVLYEDAVSYDFDLPEFG